MKMNYGKYVKEKYKFLEQYGFVFGIDPFNPNRPCYKNNFGEIVFWYDENSLVFQPIIYIQINGWKKEINVKEEYKKKFGKNGFLKSISEMFRKIFIKSAKRYGNFYDLKVVLNNNFLLKTEEISDEYFNEHFEIKKINNAFLKSIFLIVSLILLFVQLGCIIAFDIVKTEKALLIIQNILFGSIFLLSLITIITFNKKMKLVPAIFMAFFPLMMFYFLYNCSRKIDYIFYILSFIICVIYIVFSIIVQIIKKNKEHLTQAIIMSIYPTLSVFFITVELDKFVFSNITIDKKLVFIILGIVFIITLIYAILIKKHIDKKNYFGSICGVFASLLLLLFFIPHRTIDTINYVFDDSQSKIEEYYVVDKHIRHSHGRYSRTRYYLTIMVDNQLKDFSVSRVNYYKYDKYDEIYLLKHSGFLDYEYYELE